MTTTLERGVGASVSPLQRTTHATILRGSRRTIPRPPACPKAAYLSAPDGGLRGERSILRRPGWNPARASSRSRGPFYHPHQSARGAPDECRRTTARCSSSVFDSRLRGMTFQGTRRTREEFVALEEHDRRDRRDADQHVRRGRGQRRRRHAAMAEALGQGPRAAPLLDSCTACCGLLARNGLPSQRHAVLNAPLRQGCGGQAAGRGARPDGRHRRPG